MDETTVNALLGSIEKWQGIVEGDVFDSGHENCPLCQRFQNTSRPSGVCDGCPVKKKTGMAMCYGTPYDRWLLVEPDWSKTDKKYSHNEKSIAAAKDELAFLESLLPAAESAP